MVTLICAWLGSMLMSPSVFDSLPWAVLPDGQHVGLHFLRLTMEIELEAFLQQPCAIARKPRH